MASSVPFCPFNPYGLVLFKSTSFCVSNHIQYSGSPPIRALESSSISPKTSFPISGHTQYGVLRHMRSIRALKSSSIAAKTEGDLKLRCTIPEKCHPQIITIRERANSWLRSYIQSPEIEAADFATLIMSQAPQGSMEGAINLLKFSLFIIPFDDHLDHFAENNEQLINTAAQIVEGKTMQGSEKHLPFMKMLEDLCKEVRKSTTEVQWKRFVKNFRLYLEGVKEQEKLRVVHGLEPPSISDYMKIRNKVTAVQPAWCLLPQMVGVDLEDEIWNHEKLLEIQRLVSDHHVVVNDVMSFSKDDGLMWNLTSILVKTRGCRMREAVALSCRIAEQIEHKFLRCLDEFKASPLVRNQSRLLTFLDLVPFQISGHLTWLSRNPLYGSHSVTKEGHHTIVSFQNLL